MIDKIYIEKTKEELNQEGFKQIEDTYLYINEKYDLYNDLGKYLTNVKNSKKITFYKFFEDGSKKRRELSVKTIMKKLFTKGDFVDITYKGITDYKIDRNTLKVYNKKTGTEKTVSLRNNNKGKDYSSMSFQVDGKKLSLRFHQIVAHTLLPKPDDFEEKKYEINHIDGDKTNYQLSNLEWVTRKENMQHAYKTGLYDNVLHQFAIFDKDKNYICSILGSERVMEYINYNNKQILRRAALNNLKAVNDEDLRSLNGYYVIYENRSSLKV